MARERILAGAGQSSALHAALLAGLVLAGAPLHALPAGPPPPLPPLEDPDAARLQGSERGPAARSGTRLVIEGSGQRARWLWIGPSPGSPPQLWLPLEVLQQGIGMSSRSLPGGSIELEWFGRTLRVPAANQRPLGDEVALEVAPLLLESGLLLRVEGDQLVLSLPPARLIGVRSSGGAQAGQRRLVLDLSAPSLLRREERQLQLTLQSSPSQRAELTAQGLRALEQNRQLRLLAAAGREPLRVFTLGGPSRVVIDLPAGDAALTPPPEGGAAPALDPRLQARLGRQIRWDRLERLVGERRVRINAVRIDPRIGDLMLRPLSRADGMEGLSSLAGLARRQDALVAINGGFFNRIRRLPLGALRDRGAWLSGPILNRGAIGWQPGGLPRFGRLRLQEWVLDGRGNRWPLVVLNSGYVQRGLSRYTAAWGPLYRSLSDGEAAVLVRQGRVVAHYGAEALAAGLPLTPGDWLLVGRGGVLPPWPEGESLGLGSRLSDPLGEKPYVIGGGPLLLLDGRPVLDGGAEGFAASFLSQGAPRTVIGSDGREIWLITLEGSRDEGPTLGETASILQGMGIRDALNLDGGSSTGLVMGGIHTVRGRGVAGAVHNGLGLVPAAAEPPRRDEGGAQGS